MPTSDIHAVQQLIQKTNSLIIEIGGPTLQGYEILQKHSIQLPRPMTVTNITEQIEMWNSKDAAFVVCTVDAIADVRALPYDNNSIGMVLTSNLPIASYNDDTEQALQEYAQPDAPQTNYHLFLYKECARVLKEGGLLVQVNPTDEDGAAAARYGLHKIYAEEDQDATIVFTKARLAN